MGTSAVGLRTWCGWRWKICNLHSICAEFICNWVWPHHWGFLPQNVWSTWAKPIDRTGTKEKKQQIFIAKWPKKCTLTFILEEVQPYLFVQKTATSDKCFNTILNINETIHQVQSCRANYRWWDCQQRIRGKLKFLHLFYFIFSFCVNFIYLFQYPGLFLFTFILPLVFMLDSTWPLRTRIRTFWRSTNTL